MVYPLRFFRPVRAASLSSPHSRRFYSNGIDHFYEDKLHLMKLKSLAPQAHGLVPKSHWKLVARQFLHIFRHSDYKLENELHSNSLLVLFNCLFSILTVKLFAYRRYVHSFRHPGFKLSVDNVVGFCAFLGLMRLWPHIAYSADGFQVSRDNYPSGLSNGSSSADNILALLNVIHKLLVPVFLLLTVWLNWGQPVITIAKVALILIGTKPVPSSVYVFIEQLQNQIMRQHPFFYRFKPLHAKTVEVEDYFFLCLAKVEIKDERFTLIGILGSWWILPLLQQKEVFLLNKSLWEELFSSLKSRFRLAVYM